MKSAMRAVGIFFFALAAGCAEVGKAPPGLTAQSEPRQSEPQASKPEVSKPQVSKPQVSEPLVLTPPVTTPPAVAPQAKTPPKGSVPSVAVQPQKNEKPVAVAKPLEPPLDVAALQARLRDTKAIGVLTKLALKNQVDDLLKQFKAHYQSGQKAGVAALRQPYDMLVLKVLSLLQDSDPALARTISASREAIWSILADREKFNALT
jgi:hypothetical protein